MVGSVECKIVGVLVGAALCSREPHGCGFRCRAAIEEDHMEQALGAFEKVGRDQELI
jgi:hypothetical protein